MQLLGMQIPKVQKNTVKLSVFFFYALLGSVPVNALMLVTLTPRDMIESKALLPGCEPLL